MAVYGPSDDWPDHRQAWFRDALDTARSRGWSLEGPTGHNAYTLHCPTRACFFVAYSTGRGGESAAKTLTKKVKRCIHGHVESLSRAEELLDQAATLLNAAELLWERRLAYARALAAMDLPGATDDDIEDLLLSADELLAGAVSLGVDATVEQPEPHVEGAEHRLEEAHEVLAPLPSGPPAVVALRDRAKRLCRDLASLRGRIAGSP